MLNWWIIIPAGVAILLLILFLIKRNWKDEKDFENKIKNDYRKPTAEEQDINIDDTMK